MSGNLDTRTVKGFGDEWDAFRPDALPDADAEAMFQSFFSVFPWEALPPAAEGFDLGCGSGRWAVRVAPRVGRLHCIEPATKALAVARETLRDHPNCVLHHAGVGEMPLAPDSMDFGYALGVLHHVPDTLAGLRACVERLKPGAPFLLYLYYRLENRPLWYRALWRGADGIRRVVSRLPHRAKLAVSGVLAALAYWPLSRLALLVERLGGDPDKVPLAWYRHRAFFVLRTDAYDRFCTPLEKRFTRAEIESMMRKAGLRDLRFAEQAPYWCAVGYRESGASGSSARAASR